MPCITDLAVDGAISQPEKQADIISLLKKPGGHHHTVLPSSHFHEGESVLLALPAPGLESDPEAKHGKRGPGSEGVRDRARRDKKPLGMLHGAQSPPLQRLVAGRCGCCGQRRTKSRRPKSEQGKARQIPAVQTPAKPLGHSERMGPSRQGQAQAQAGPCSSLTFSGPVIESG